MATAAHSAAGFQQSVECDWPTLLIRENYLDLPDASGFRSEFENYFRQQMNRDGLGGFLERTTSSDWRESVVGLHMAASLLGREIRSSGRIATDHSLVRNDRPDLLYQPLLCRPWLVVCTLGLHSGPAESILRSPYLEDSFDAYAAAITSVWIQRIAKPRSLSDRTPPPLGLPMPLILLPKSLSGPLHDEFGECEADFLASAQRFADSVVFWGGDRFRVRL
jgi:hypothetical protein